MLKLVRNPRTEIRVVIESSENEFNEREILLNKIFLCNWQDSAAIRYTQDKQSPEIAGTAYIDGDILPTQQVDSGYVVIFGTKYQIKKGTKARNLDGSVNYTKLEVI